MLKRVAKGAAGSNAVAGSGRLDRVESGSGNIFDPTCRIEGDTVTATGDGDSCTAKLGGKAVPNMVNGKAGGTVSVKMLGKDTLRATYANDGKVTNTTTLTVSRDGKTMKMVDHDMRSGATTTMTDNRTWPVRIRPLHAGHGLRKARFAGRSFHPLIPFPGHKYE